MTLFARIITALVCCAFFATACGSVPILEPAECAEARETVRTFYSMHFAGEMRFSPENIERKLEYLTPEFAASLPSEESEADVFTTNTDDIPRAFRAGACSADGPERATIRVLLFWRDDESSKQQPVNIETVLRGDRWLINSIAPAS